ncbi:MAG: N-acetylglucosamine-6-phosphate deacetylase [Trueperaceae bacterium]
MKELHGRILTPAGLLRGTVRFDDRIVQIEPAEVDGPLIVPGFIDGHVHGGGGGDTMDGAEGVRKLARFHLSHGTTTILPTTMTNPWEKVLAALDGVSQVRSAPSAAGADEVLLPNIPGAHLEGPFISHERLGAQPPFTLHPEPELVEEVLGRDVVRVVTLAPELPGAFRAARMFAGAGVRVSVGHTAADYETVRELARAMREASATYGFTHLFNAMGGIAGREPGVAGAALALVEAHAELIFDGHHVAEGSLHATRAAKGRRLHFVSDCIRAGGLGDGPSELGGLEVTVKGGAARLADGTLAGSVLTLDQALRNALRVGVPLAEATDLVSGSPARYLGLSDRGQIAVGLRADLVELDDEFEVRGVWVGGRQV